MRSLMWMKWGLATATTTSLMLLLSLTWWRVMMRMMVVMVLGHSCIHIFKFFTDQNLTSTVARVLLRSNPVVANSIFLNL